MTWVLEDAPIPRDAADAASLTLVLIGLANHADRDGRHAFPSVATLAHYVRLSERTVQRALGRLEELGLIELGNQRIVAAHVDRPDRRPRVWNLQMKRGDSSDTPLPNGVTGTTNGVTAATERGVTVSPEPSLNRTDEPGDLSLDLGLQAASKNDASDVDEVFARFWAAYPRKVSKAGAKAKFAGAVKAGADPEAVVAGAVRYAKEREGQDVNFTKHPTTWLHNGCWEDEVTPARAGRGGHQPYKDAAVWGT